MKQSGAKLIEVGTTNRVRLSDYREALETSAALVMRAHRSNFKIVGFTEEPEPKEIVDMAHQANVLVVDDLGSGALLDTAKYGFAHEPTVQESLAAGVDLVCFSGDKLLGGPQAGIILGRKTLIDKIKKHPLARAVRADKTCLAGITATLLHYLKDEAEKEIPIWQMMALTLEQLKVRADAWRAALGQGEVVPSESTAGGGSLPEECIPTYVLALRVKSPVLFLKKLRDANTPIIARTENDRVLLDPRTVLDDKLLLQTLHQVVRDYR
jgi:L-seryl-tRNA(Ser) seleniumtransferase